MRRDCYAEILRSESCSLSSSLLPLFSCRSQEAHPLTKGALWPALEIATALRNAGMGESVEQLLERVLAIPKSAVAAPGERPSLGTQVDSLQTIVTIASPSAITLIDDVVTKGTFVAKENE